MGTDWKRFEPGSSDVEIRGFASLCGANLGHTEFMARGILAPKGGV